MKYHFDDISAEWISSFKKQSTSGFLFSPYITNNPFIDYLISCEINHCIYTDFSLIAFANGASDLSVLKKLFQNGHDIFHIPSLHAKLVVIPQKYVSIGSQNITNKGKSNKEASISFLNPNDTNVIMKLINPWLEQRQPITTSMINKASNAIKDYKEELETTQNSLKKLTLKILDTQTQNKNNSFTNAIQKSTLSDTGLIAKIKFVNGDPSKTSLVWTKKQPITVWTIENNKIQLLEKHRYLFLLGNKIGWARVNKTQISIIGSEIINLDTIKICNMTYDIDVTAQWSRGAKSNIIIKLSNLSKKGRITLRALYTINEIKITDYSIKGEENINSISSFINDNKYNIENEIKLKLIKPFKYEKNLYGKSAETFFDRVGSSFLIKLAKFGNNLFLVGEPL